MGVMCLFVMVEVELERLSSDDAGGDPGCGKEMLQSSCWDAESKDFIEPSVGETVGSPRERGGSILPTARPCREGEAEYVEGIRRRCGVCLCLMSRVFVR